MNGAIKDMPQNIILEGRNKLKVTGVHDIDSFSESKVVLNTTLGELLIRGEDLHIIMLETATGDFTLNGNVSSMVYNSCSVNANVFRKIFR